MTKAARTVFLCQQCGGQSPKWLGRCPDCGQWNTLVEMSQAAAHQEKAVGTAKEMSQISSADFPRTVSPFAEFDRVLGGGIVPGSLILVGGDPGIGKSTLLLQITAMLAQKLGKVLYVSGEESEQQIKLRATRLGIQGQGLYLFSETDLDSIMGQLQSLSPRLAVVDSIQAVYLPELASPAGSLSQVKECTMRLMRWAKSSNTPLVLIGHVTKEGSIAGPHSLEHIVDVVLYLEGEQFSSYRLLRGVKNRFGSTNEVGIFEMRDAGMVEVSNPSQAFVMERSREAIGSVIVPALEGTRPLLVEIQALTSPTTFSQARRTANGLDFNRLLLVAAVLSKRLRLMLGNQDIIANVVGGLKVNEPAADLGLALAILSSLKNRWVKPDLVALGEIGLSGELRAVNQIDKRLAEIAKLGFKGCILPASARGKVAPPAGLELLFAATVSEAAVLAFPNEPRTVPEPADLD
ncbi:MAG: DNA repair protein RadA [Dehalococcoidia bacterium]|nr:DNA repair protein RadA [Dehalococcoidia bacterium]